MLIIVPKLLTPPPCLHQHIWEADFIAENDLTLKHHIAKSTFFHLKSNRTPPGHLKLFGCFFIYSFLYYLYHRAANSQRKTPSWLLSPPQINWFHVPACICYWPETLWGPCMWISLGCYSSYPIQRSSLWLSHHEITHMVLHPEGGAWIHRACLNIHNPYCMLNHIASAAISASHSPGLSFPLSGGIRLFHSIVFSPVAANMK